MLEQAKGHRPGLVIVRAEGKVSKDDYAKVLVPAFERARTQGQRIRFLYQLGPEFEGFSVGALWQDAQVGRRYLRSFERCAVVSDIRWIRGGARLVGALMPCAVRVFSNHEWQAALQWLESPLGATPVYRILEDRGVLVVEPRGKLRTEDFDALQASVDTWLERAGEDRLQGLVIRAEAFPGWDDLPSALRHLRFVRAHHKRIRRVAWAVDGTLASVAEPLARHFVEAEIKRFDPQALDDAVEWASGSGPREQASTEQSPPTAASSR